MATPGEKLAESLAALEAVQAKGMVAIRSRMLSRTHRERLTKAGFLQEVMKGWYIATRPEEAKGESTAWYAAFWDFCAAYLNERFGNLWSLSPEQSLLLHAGNRSIPRQLLVRAPGARNKVTAFPFDTSLLETRATIPGAKLAHKIDGLRTFALSSALVAVGPAFFRQHPTEARVGLTMVYSASEVLEILLAGGHTVVAGRLAGAFRNIGRDRVADDIAKTMRSADYGVREHDPFDELPAFEGARQSDPPHVTRMRLTWRTMREGIVATFPEGPGQTANPEAYLETVDELYVEDAYHSLSIEGYRVSPELIERVRGGVWNPDLHAGDSEQRDAMAARGYYEAFQTVKKTIADILKGKNPSTAVEDDHSSWYRELFAPSVRAGILMAADLAGYRNFQVYIRNAKHVPPRHEAVRDLMPAFFEALREEPNAAVRGVLGHFMFVYIHPYRDGNGRIARFLMNAMLASGGYPWIVIPTERRTEYMDALEAASTDSDITPFAKFIATLLMARTATLASRHSMGPKMGPTMGPKTGPAMGPKSGG